MSLLPFPAKSPVSTDLIAMFLCLGVPVGTVALQRLVLRVGRWTSPYEPIGSNVPHVQDHNGSNKTWFILNRMFSKIRSFHTQWIRWSVASANEVVNELSYQMPTGNTLLSAARCRSFFDSIPQKHAKVAHSEDIVVKRGDNHFS